MLNTNIFHVFEYNSVNHTICEPAWQTDNLKNFKKHKNAHDTWKRTWHKTHENTKKVLNYCPILTNTDIKKCYCYCHRDSFADILMPERYSSSNLYCAQYFKNSSDYHSSNGSHAVESQLLIHFLSDFLANAINVSWVTAAIN